jgi:hypothetical protein
MTLRIKDTQHHAECHDAECGVLRIVMLSVVMPNGVLLNVYCPIYGDC